MAKIFDKIFGEDKGEDKGFKQGSQLSRSNGTAFGFKATGLGAQKDTLGQKVIDMDYTNWTGGDDYKNLTKRYSDQGKLAMEDTMGQLATRTGGLPSTAAIYAGQQAYGNWMNKLEDAARSLYDSQRGDALENYGIASDDYDRQYNMYDNDRKFAFDQDKFDVSQSNWEAEFDREGQLYDDEKATATKNDFMDDVYTEFYFMGSDTLAGVSWEDYKEEFEAQGLTERDFNNLKSQAVKSQNEENKAASDEEAAEATDMIIMCMESGRWDKMSNSQKRQWIDASGKSMSYWKVYELNQNNAAEGKPALSAEDFSTVMKYAEPLAKQGPKQLFEYLTYLLGNSDLATDIYNTFYDPDTGELIYDFDKEE